MGEKEWEWGWGRQMGTLLMGMVLELCPLETVINSLGQARVIIQEVDACFD